MSSCLKVTALASHFKKCLSEQLLKHTRHFVVIKMPGNHFDTHKMLFMIIRTSEFDV